MVCLFPIHPGKSVVLTICVIVTELSTPNLVSPKHHRNTLRQHKGRQQVSALTMPEAIYRAIPRHSLGAAIPGTIVVLSIPIRLAIAFVMFFIVGHQVGQSESIVAGNEINTGRWTAPVHLIEIRTP